jgi:hypothetical protein
MGAGALLTAGISGWTLLEWLQPKAPEEPAPLLRALSPGYGKLNAANAGELAAELLRQTELHCQDGPDAQALQFRGSVLGQCVLRDTLAACQLEEPAAPACQALLRQRAQLRTCFSEPFRPPRLPLWGNATWVHEPLRCRGTLTWSPERERAGRPSRAASAAP